MPKTITHGWQFKALRVSAAFMLLFCLSLPAYAGDRPAGEKPGGGDNDGIPAGVIPAVSNTNYIGSASLPGLNAEADDKNFSVTAHGICRFIDVVGNDDILVPFRNLNDKPEWQNFIQNVKVEQARLHLCRPPYALSTLDGGTKIDFAPALSTNRAGVNANERGTVTPVGTATAYSVDPAPLKRIDTTSVSTLNIFRNTVEDRTQPFNMTRDDCRTLTYPDGIARDPVCNTQRWIENVIARFRYNLSANPSVDSDTDTVVRNKLIPLQRDPAAPADVGRWLKTLIPDDSVPAFAPPPLRDCGSHKHGDKYWEDQPPLQEQTLPCPTGTISDPTDPYRRTWMNEREYQCFDADKFEGAYPMPNVREKAGTSQIIGRCLPVTSGQCGSANGGSFASAPGSGLCNAGTPSGVGGSGPWSWSCIGSNGGATVSCGANVAAACVSNPTQTTSVPCGAGYTGDRYYTRDTDSCGNDTGWQPAGDSCAPTGPGPGGPCTPYTQTNNVGCAANETGTHIDRRDWDSCGHDSGWYTQINTCTPKACVPSPQTQTRTVGCPAGQTGTVTEQRTTDGCGYDSGWSQVSASCSVVNNCHMSVSIKFITGMPGHCDYAYIPDACSPGEQDIQDLWNCTVIAKCVCN